jgi:hypothetical protein
MPAADPDVKSIFTEIRYTREQVCRIVVHGLTGEKPTHMSPKTTFARRVGITFLVRVLVMLTVRRYPKDGATLKRQRGADRKQIFHPLGSLVTAMRKKAMVSNTYAETSGHPPQNHCKEECLPIEEEQGSHCADVKRNHDECCDPNNGLRKCSVVREYPWYLHIALST